MRVRCTAGRCDARVFPDAGEWHSTPLPDGSWDWNCDGTQELEYPTKGTCAGCRLQQGFYRVPSCGGRGEKVSGCIQRPYSACGAIYEYGNTSQQRCR